MYGYLLLCSRYQTANVCCAIDGDNEKKYRRTLQILERHKFCGFVVKKTSINTNKLICVLPQMEGVSNGPSDRKHDIGYMLTKKKNRMIF